MTTVVKTNTPLVIPPAIQRRAGITPGDHVEFKAIRGVITIVTKPPTADDEYTPRQRRTIDAQLDEAEKGPFYGPFETHEDMIKFLHGEVKKAKAKKICKAKTR